MDVQIPQEKEGGNQVYGMVLPKSGSWLSDRNFRLSSESRAKLE